VVTGLFYGGGASQLIGQAIGSACIGGGTFVVSMALMYAVKATRALRVSKEGELEGLDLHEHGGGAYPELVGSSRGFVLPEEAASSARGPVPVPSAATT
jgi:Amt family ammonium transporter